jgi:hypothetical protein
MIIELTYKYSELDKDKQFGIVFHNVYPPQENYVRWVYYYLGLMIGEKKPSIYPFAMRGAKIKKEYKYCADAERQAKLLTNCINKLLSK